MNVILQPCQNIIRNEPCQHRLVRLVLYIYVVELPKQKGVNVWQPRSVDNLMKL